MNELLIGVVAFVALVVAWVYLSGQRRNRRERELEDAKAEARRWVERLGGQVLSLTGTDIASQQAISDASERYTAAGAQLERAESLHQARLVTDTAVEGLYYVRAARTAMGMDPGPALPDEAERARAGAVTETRDVEVEGHRYAAAPGPGEDTPHYFPGGRVAGRPVPAGWYSEPWWKPALTAGAWGMGSVLLFSALFSGMGGIPGAQAWEAGYDAGQEGALDGGSGSDAGGEPGGGEPGGSGFDIGDIGF
ncbi:hypothetical protein H0B56_12715 [Haloechinothrix sp. YIM 98757]|uniref:DUF1542 domain-containing protein n=1 Tax=Haloechinothrix aidingensis TaxID=2752311 RepID=A0A838AB15_9PSEU|nr:hypothetical protein [Haloechinothrix aidingensis]MBA0126405.1 hypothetical protein [Haloechinothrix aidingensis]